MQSTYPVPNLSEVNKELLVFVAFSGQSGAGVQPFLDMTSLTCERDDTAGVCCVNVRSLL